MTIESVNAEGLFVRRDDELVLLSHATISCQYSKAPDNDCDNESRVLLLDSTVPFHDVATLAEVIVAV
jgi:hypothetical protein